MHAKDNVSNVFQKPIVPNFLLLPKDMRALTTNALKIHVTQIVQKNVRFVALMFVLNHVHRAVKKMSTVAKTAPGVIPLIQAPLNHGLTTSCSKKSHPTLESAPFTLTTDYLYTRTKGLLRR